MLNSGQFGHAPLPLHHDVTPLPDVDPLLSNNSHMDLASPASEAIDSFPDPSPTLPPKSLTLASSYHETVNYRLDYEIASHI